MLQNIKKRNEGFTIIEVLIVLAIAGLIMLIVFLAVPALQRNSRNTRRRDDVGKALAAVNDWVTNNGGKIPTEGTAAEVTQATSDIQDAAGLSTGVTLVLGKEKGKLVDGTGDVIQIISSSSCGGSGVATKPLANQKKADLGALLDDSANDRTISAVFLIEASGNNFTRQCQGS